MTGSYNGNIDDMPFSNEVSITFSFFTVSLYSAPKKRKNKTSTIAKQTMTS